MLQEKFPEPCRLRPHHCQESVAGNIRTAVVPIDKDVESSLGSAVYGSNEFAIVIVISRRVVVGVDQPGGDAAAKNNVARQLQRFGAFCRMPIHATIQVRRGQSR
jgi:hypothetical protein